MKISKAYLYAIIEEEVRLTLLEQELANNLLMEGVAGDFFKSLKDKFVQGVEMVAQAGGGETEVQQGMQDFFDAYSEMMHFNVKGADKFFHCVANNMATHRGWAGKAFAIVFSELREISDMIKPTGTSLKDRLKDRKEDLAANALGRDTVGDPEAIKDTPDWMTEEHVAAIDACRSVLPPCATFGYSDDKGFSSAEYDGDFDACSYYQRREKGV